MSLQYSARVLNAPNFCGMHFRCLLIVGLSIEEVDQANKVTGSQQLDLGAYKIINFVDILLQRMVPP